MKGSIALCVKDLVTEKFGKEKWDEVIKNAGLTREPLLTLLTDLDDKVMMDIINSVSKTLNLNMNQVSDAFGEYWVCNFAPKYYSRYMEGLKSAKDMLLAMDNVHVKVTQNIQNAHPPRFEYNWVNDKTLVMKYKSSRGLIDLLVGLVKGVGKHFKENISVRKLNPTEVEVKFY